MLCPPKFECAQPGHHISLAQRWSRPSGYGEVLTLAWPLVLSSGSVTLQHFINRVFLSWYAPTEMAAALPAGMLSWSITSLFVGAAAYINTFVAQYYGAGRKDRIGPAVWQAIYFSIAAALVVLACIPFAGIIFHWVGHEPEVQRLEASFFRILCLGAGFTIYSNAISGFFSGRGKTAAILYVNLLVSTVNILLDYLWIFGKAGFPRAGIVGAGWATVVASACGALVFTILFLAPRNQRLFDTLRGFRLDYSLFMRLLRYGMPSGAHWMLESLGFTLFVFFVGRIGTAELGATQIAWNINTIAFMPMMGFGIAVSTLVGQRLGENNPELANRATWSAFHMTFVYMTVISLLYVVIPDIFIFPFQAYADPSAIAPMRNMVVILLRFVAIYSIFDTMNVIFASGLKGAGDTRFVMLCSVILAWVVMVMPAWLITARSSGGIYSLWAFMSAYVILLAFGFLARFLQGKWKDMRVIEASDPQPKGDKPCAS